MTPKDTAVDTALSFECHKCHRTAATKPDKRGARRVPGGWKTFQKLLWCNTCWSEWFVVRAVTFPVASPLDIPWDEFRERLKLAWQQATQLANLSVRELAKADVTRGPSMTKLPPAPKIYLYPIGRAALPDLNSQSVVAIQHAVTAKYNRARLETIWRGEASFPHIRYPMPYPVPATTWRARWLSPKERVPVVSLPLGGERIELRLRGSADFRRQLAQFALFISEEAVPGTLELYRQRASEGDHRTLLPAATPAGGKTVHWRIMCKLVGWFPKRARPGQELITLRTDQDHFLVAELPNREPFILNADHVRRWIAAHRQRLERIAVDTKFEKRWPARKRLQINEARAVWVDKHARRLHSFCHEAAACMVKFAVRQKVGRIEYSDTERGYLAEFPWFKLQTLLAEKAQQNNIEFVSAPTPTVGEGAPAETENNENKS